MCVWLSLLSVTVSGSIHVTVNGIILFFVMTSILPCICITSSLSIPVSGHVGCFHVLASLVAQLIKEHACQCRRHKRCLVFKTSGSMPALGRSPGGGNGNPLQYSCLENPMDERTWQATVRGGHRVGHYWVHEHRHVLAIVNCAAVNIGVHVSFKIMVFSGYLPRSGIAGSYGSSLFSVFKEPPYFFL